MNLLKNSIFDRRSAGILLHPTSLPGKQWQGDIGQPAKDFINFMVDAGLTVWQMLPLGPTHIDRSPYQCLSTHAGNPHLINLDWLLQHGWLDQADIDQHQKDLSLIPVLEKASVNFYRDAEPHWHHKQQAFIQQSSYWLPDYALYLSLKRSLQNLSWEYWPAPYRDRDPEALIKVREQHAERIKTVEFIQFIFFEQWHELRNYATQRGIKLFGDMPIYVSMDSADVWAQRENFLINEKGFCTYVAGVPPDAFSADGQLWGNPLYNWAAMQKNDFSWWVNRFRTQLELFDYIRIDHFRALEACWQIPAEAETAAEGSWVESPGGALLNKLHEYFDSLPLIAEDLGVITEQVIALREQFNLPGMAVLQFAFDGASDNFYLPHNHQRNSVVYTGTHDNNTSLGWYQEMPEHLKHQLHEYIGVPANQSLDMPWVLNRMALASVADLAILPMQDILSLDSTHRMNTPGTTIGNWKWRFNWDQMWPSLAADLRQLIQLFGRL
jgi:4-alpha-glucanotransferase